MPAIARTNQFGFTITGTTNLPILVASCTNPADPTRFVQPDEWCNNEHRICVVDTSPLVGAMGARGRYALVLTQLQHPLRYPI